MVKFMLSAGLVLLSPWVLAQQQDDLKASVQEALAKVASLNDQCWAYTLSGSAGDEGEFVATRDPRRGSEQLWRLEKSFGNQPEATRQANFQKSRARDEIAPISAAIDWDSLQLLSQGSGQKVVGFNPVARDDEEQALVAHLQGRLVIDETTGLLKQISWQSKNEFQPRFGVTLRRFLVQVDYQLIDQWLFPDQAKVEADGVAMMVKTIERRFTTASSDFINTCTNIRL